LKHIGQLQSKVDNPRGIANAIPQFSGKYFNTKQYELLDRLADEAFK
jgi:hypothetical protein